MRSLKGSREVESSQISGSEAQRTYTLEEFRSQILDAKAVAEVLGVTYDWVRRITTQQSSNFPDPVIVLGSSRGWLREHVQVWVDRERGVVGRPPLFPDLRDQLAHRYSRNHASAYLTPYQLAEFLRMTSADMKAWRDVGYGPSWCAVQTNRGVLVRYDLDVVVKWLQSEQRHLERIADELGVVEPPGGECGT